MTYTYIFISKNSSAVISLSAENQIEAEKELAATLGLTSQDFRLDDIGDTDEDGEL